MNARIFRLIITWNVLLTALLISMAFDLSTPLVDTALAAANKVKCITVGDGLLPGGKKCKNFTLTANFTAAGGNNGTATTVARGDHDHDATYVNIAGDTMTGDLIAANLKAGAPTSEGCNGAGDVCAADDVVADGDAGAEDDIIVGDDVLQALAGNGAVKAGVYAVCGDSGQRIIDSFDNTFEGGAAPTILPVAEGRCTIHFDFDVSTRYIVAMAAATGGALIRGVTVNTVSGNDVTFYRWFQGPGGLLTGTDGEIFVLVY